MYSYCLWVNVGDVEDAGDVEDNVNVVDVRSCGTAEDLRESVWLLSVWHVRVTIIFYACDFFFLSIT